MDDPTEVSGEALQLFVEFARRNPLIPSDSSVWPPLLRAYIATTPTVAIPEQETT